jgi:hypothetical protein
LLTHDAPALSNGENARVRRWAFALLTRAFESVAAVLARYLTGPGSENLSEEQLDEARALVRLQEIAVHQVYFASEAYAKPQAQREEQFDDDGADTRAAGVARFASESEHLLRLMCRCRLSAVAYDVLGTLQHLRSADPRRIFLLIGEVVQSAAADAFQFELLAADRVVEIVEQYLAEYRGLFRNDPELIQTLMDLLDRFVEAGWPKATALTYRLDEVFRG